MHAFDSDFCLVGGTAIALHIGHRESLDFDLFTKHPDTTFDTRNILRKLRAHVSIDHSIRNEAQELTVIGDGVQFTFFHFDYAVPCDVRFADIIDIPDLLTLSAMKMFALGQRAKWKDYVDLYFVMRDHFSLGEIAARAKELFGGEFNERLVRQQLSYFTDVDYTEDVVFKPGFEVSDDEVKNALMDYSTA